MFEQDQKKFRGVRAQKNKTRVISWILNQYKKNLKILNFVTTYAILMKLTADIHLNKVFHFAEFQGVSHREYKGANKKNYQNKPKIIFLAQFRPFLINSKNCSISDASFFLSLLVKTVAAFGELWPKIHPKSSIKWQFLLYKNN